MTRRSLIINFFLLILTLLITSGCARNNRQIANSTHAPVQNLPTLPKGIKTTIVTIVNPGRTGAEKFISGWLAGLFLKPGEHYTTKLPQVKQTHRWLHESLYKGIWKRCRAKIKIDGESKFIFIVPPHEDSQFDLRGHGDLNVCNR